MNRIIILLSSILLSHTAVSQTSVTGRRDITYLHHVMNGDILDMKVLLSLDGEEREWSKHIENMLKEKVGMNVSDSSRQIYIYRLNLFLRTLTIKENPFKTFLEKLRWIKYREAGPNGIHFVLDRETVIVNEQGQYVAAVLWEDVLSREQICHGNECYDLAAKLYEEKKGNVFLFKVQEYSQNHLFAIYDNEVHFYKYTEDSYNETPWQSFITEYNEKH